MAEVNPANKGSDSVILPMEGNPVWRHKRSLPDEPECYTGNHFLIRVTHTSLIAYPEYTPVARFTASSISMLNNNNKRKCVPSNYVVYPNATILFQRNAHALREPIHNDFIEHCLKNTGIFKLLTGKYY